MAIRIWSITCSWPTIALASSLLIAWWAARRFWMAWRSASSPVPRAVGGRPAARDGSCVGGVLADMGPFPGWMTRLTARGARRIIPEGHGAVEVGAAGGRVLGASCRTDVY